MLNRKQAVLALILVSLLTLTIHILLHDRYRIFYEDDVWSPSHTHTLMTTGQEIDRIFHTPERNIRWTFGKTYDYVYGVLAEVFGWSRSGIHLISKLLVLLGALLWFRIARELGYSVVLAWSLFFGLLLIEPLVSTANISRKDALAFCLIALQLFLLLKRRFVAAALSAGIAFETHPMGSVAVLLSAGILWLRRREWLAGGQWKRVLLKLAIGGALGVAYFLLLHIDTFSFSKFFRAYSRSNMFSGFKMEYGWNNFLYVYLVHEKHLFQLGFYLLSIALFVWKRDWRRDRTALLLLGVLVLASILLRRPNLHYMTYATPLLLLFSFSTLERHRRFAVLAVVLFGILTTGYLSRYVEHREYSNAAMTARITPLVPRDGLPVVAQPDLWFAFRDRRFVPTHFMDPWEELKLTNFYFIRDEWAAVYDSWFYKRAESSCLSNAVATPLGKTFRIGRFRLHVLRIRKR